MSEYGDAADTALRLTLRGVRITLTAAAKAAARTGMLLAAALRQQKDSQAERQLAALRDAGEDLAVFPLPERDLAVFTEKSREYGVEYLVLRDEYGRSPDRNIRILAAGKDRYRVQHILDRYGLGKERRKEKEAPEPEKEEKRPGSREILREATDGRRAPDPPRARSAEEDRAAEAERNKAREKLLTGMALLKQKQAKEREAER